MELHLTFQQRGRILKIHSKELHAMMIVIYYSQDFGRCAAQMLRSCSAAKSGSDVKEKLVVYNKKCLK